jgi:uncharacterized protein YecE (DUF72 family)
MTANIMKTKLYVGQSSLRGALGKYKKRFNLLELRAEPGRTPRTGLLQRWSEEAGENFVFSVMLSRHVGQLGKDCAAAIQLGQDAANALNARWIVVQTDPTVGPSRRSRQRLSELFSRLMGSGRKVAWEPHGVWQDEDALAWTSKIGVHLVRDISRADVVTDPIIYTRLLGLGTAARMSAGALEKAAASLLQASEAYVVACGDAAGRVTQTLRGIVAGTTGTSSLGSGLLELPDLFDDLTGNVESDDGVDDFDDEESFQDDPEVGEGPFLVAELPDDGGAASRASSLKKRSGAKRR